eukprot:TRINITY_DN41651_c0_g1_i1.p1 TRINITY_DN41651_c0_g1~~TRINITY_DN41651_c0_g1_i1.p1  ORF type:complete len:347 (+),score=66.00 TRINITY_DN41651_c0_g1_i1:17-1057(+)
MGVHALAGIMPPPRRDASLVEDTQDVSLVRVLLILLSCLVYISSSSWVIITNQRLIKEVGFPYPVLLSALGTMASAATAHLTSAVGLTQVRPEAASFRKGDSWLRNVVPVALCQAATLASGNAMYVHLGVGFTQMLKAGTPIFVLAVLVFMRLEPPSAAKFFFVGLITVGTLITAATTPEFSSTGLMYGVFAMVTEALRVGLTQFVLKSCKFSVTEGQYVLSPSVSLALLLAALPLELRAALQPDALWKVAEHPYLFMMAAGLGILVNYSSYWVIKTCGALTLKVVSIVRNIALIVYSCLVLGEAVDEKQGLGYSIALVGFIGYTCLGNRATSPTSTPTGTHVKAM